MKRNAIILSFMLWGAVSAWSQAPYATPEEAVKALKSAVAAKDDKPLFALFGPELQKIVPPSVEGRQDARRVVAALLKERWRLAYLDEDRKLLRLGNEGWPFPVTLVKSDQGWKFDTAAGIEEINNRKIGTNELVNLETCKCLMLAEEDYYSRDSDKDGVREYSSLFRSNKSKRDGLYWQPAKGEVVSPLEMALKGAARYAVHRTKGTPWFGYRYRFLEGQGSQAPGGAYSYGEHGNQVGGWAVVAYPASHGSTGYKTFICNQNGKIYEKDLGADTARLAEEMRLFDPGEGWTVVDDQDLVR